MKTKARFASRPLLNRSASLPPYDHPAIMAGKSLYPYTVRPALSGDRWALKSGEHQRKIGAVILKGRWKGFPVFTLSLENAGRAREAVRTGEAAWATG